MLFNPCKVYNSILPHFKNTLLIRIMHIVMSGKVHHAISPQVKIHSSAKPDLSILTYIVLFFFALCYLYGFPHQVLHSFEKIYITIATVQYINQLKIQYSHAWSSPPTWQHVPQIPLLSIFPPPRPAQAPSINPTHIGLLLAAAPRSIRQRSYCSVMHRCRLRSGTPLCWDPRRIQYRHPHLYNEHGD